MTVSFGVPLQNVYIAARRSPISGTNTNRYFIGKDSSDRVRRVLSVFMAESLLIETRTIRCLHSLNRLPTLEPDDVKHTVDSLTLSLQRVSSFEKTYRYEANVRAHRPGLIQCG